MPGVCYSALRRLPRRDLHPLETNDAMHALARTHPHDAPRRNSSFLRVLRSPSCPSIPFVSFVLPDLDQPELMPPAFLYKRDEVRRETAVLDKVAGFAVRFFHDVAIADEIAGAQLRKT
jgi:hypothetical protein